MLYKAVVQEQCKKQLHILANAMDTLIPIELFYDKRKHVRRHASSSTSTSSKVVKNSRKLQSEQHIKANEVNTRKKKVQQRVSEQSGSEKREPIEYKIKVRYDKELMGALFKYMCCSLKPWWMRDGRIPAWTARVARMHDRVKTPCDERVVHETSSNVRPILEFLRHGTSLGTQPQDTGMRNAVDLYSQELPRKQADKSEAIDLFEQEWSLLSQQSGREWLLRRWCFAKDPEVAGMFAYGWKFQEWSPARRQISGQSAVNQPDVNQPDMDESGADESGVDESSVDESGVDESEKLSSDINDENAF